MRTYYISKFEGSGNLDDIQIKFEVLPGTTKIDAITHCKRFIFIKDNDFRIFCFCPEDVYSVIDTKQPLKKQFRQPLPKSVISKYMLIEENVGAKVAEAISLPFDPDYISFGDAHGDLSFITIAAKLLYKYRSALMVDVGDDTTYYRLKKPQTGEEEVVNKQWGYKATKKYENDIRKCYINSIIRPLKILKLWGNHDEQDRKNVMLIVKRSNDQLIFSHAIVVEQYMKKGERIYRKEDGCSYILKKYPFGDHGSDHLEIWKKNTGYIDYYHAKERQDRKIPSSTRIRIENRYKSYVGKVATYNPTLICGHDHLYTAVPAINSIQFPLKKLYLWKITLDDIDSKNDGNVLNNIVCVDAMSVNIK